MNLKDIFYVVGIISALIIGLTNIYISFKNRRNSLRDTIHKAQLNYFNELLKELSELHRDLTFLANNRSIANDPKEKVELIFKTSYSYMHLSSDKILDQTTDTIKTALEVIDCKDENQVKEKFNNYFKNFRILISYIRKELGTDPLSKENQFLQKSVI